MLQGQFQIHTERILSKFTEIAILKKATLYRIWLVTPWITYGKKSGDPLINLINAAYQTNPKIILITRPPESVENESAITFLRSHSSTTTFILPFLHSKIYILECDGFRMAFFGSPNFTAGGNERNREIAIDIRTTSDDKKEIAAGLITNLLTYVSELRGDADLLLQG